MSNVGYATLSVIPSFQGFQSRLSAGTAGPLAAAGKQGGAKFGDAAGREAGSSFKGRFTGALKGFSPFAGLAIGAGVTALFKGAIDEASALSESANKIDVVFGEAGEQINTFARDAASSIGQSELAARNAAASMGVFGKAAGLTGDDLAGFSTELTSLASDLASFYDTSVDQAAEALSSGLRGEAEPLRQYGVLLDDATLRIEAMKQGLIETTKEALTPQQKILAAHAVITKQTSDAQGDFARTSDGLANSQRTLSAQWADMQADLGERLLPTMTGFVSFLSDDAIPALATAGGVVEDAASAFAEIPAPVKAAVGALIAFRAASSFGITGAIGSGITSLGRGMEDVRLRTMLATDAFRTARSGVLEFAGNTGRYVAPVGRMTAAMRGLGAAATGAGSSLRRGLSGAMGLLGGPWGAALVGGTALLTAFWAEHREAKQRVDDLAASLDEQSGALTDNSEQWAARLLQESGALEAARQMGLNLETVTQAALDDAAAMTEVNDAIRAYVLETGSANQTTTAIRGGIYEVRDAVREGTAEWQLLADATGKAAGASEDAVGAIKRSADGSDWAADATSRYSTALEETEKRLQNLIDKEQERADNAVTRRRDQLGLIQALQDTREEIDEGRKTLDINTEAGQANREALYDLADQWNQSADAVRNKKGAWRDMRQEFIELAENAGAGTRQARRLADQLLKTPKVKIDSTQIDAATAKMEELERLLANIQQGRKINLGVSLSGPGGPVARLNGGPVNAGQPYIVGERRPEVFVPDRPGRIEPRVSAGGVTVNIGTVVAHDYHDFTAQMQNRARRAASDGIRRGYE